jgi:hypothetical protein
MLTKLTSVSAVANESGDEGSVTISLGAVTVPDWLSSKYVLT